MNKRELKQQERRRRIEEERTTERSINPRIRHRMSGGRNGTARMYQRSRREKIREKITRQVARRLIEGDPAPVRDVDNVEEWTVLIHRDPNIPR